MFQLISYLREVRMFLGEYGHKQAGAGCERPLWFTQTDGYQEWLAMHRRSFRNHLESMKVPETRVAECV